MSWTPFGSRVSAARADNTSRVIRCGPRRFESSSSLAARLRSRYRSRLSSVVSLPWKQWKCDVVVIVTAVDLIML
jgi:hypothetical protein